MNLRRRLAAVAGAATASTLVGLAAGQAITSPAEAAAKRAAPAASLITVPVESTVLTSRVVVRGDVRFEQATAVDLAVSGGEGDAVITRQPPAVGSSLAEGGVLTEISGRPVLVLGGEVPAYRDLRPGSEGDDVQQLEASLARLGHFGGRPDRVFDDATEGAIEAWYRGAGYVPMGPSAEEQAQLRSVREAAASAATRVRTTEAAARAAADGLPRSQRLALDAQVAAAEDGLTAARAAAADARADAEAGVVAATAALDRAAAAAGRAGRRLEQARQGTHPDTGQPPTDDELAALEEEAAIAAGDRAEADAARDVSVRAVPRVVEEHRRLVKAAEAAVAVATAAREEAVAAAASGSGPAAELAEARGVAAAATADLAALDRKVGTVLPRSEVLFLAGLPRRVDAVHLNRGAKVAGPAVTISGAQLVVDAQLSAAEQGLVAPGDEVLVEHPASSFRRAGVVASVAAAAGPDGTFALRVGLGGAPPEGGELNVKVTIPVASTDGEVLAVPVAALSAASSGAARVQVVTGRGRPRFVEVVPGLTADGLVEVRAGPGGSLAAGDLVVVGQ